MNLKRDVVSVKQTIQKLICKPFFRISVPRIKLGNDHDTKKYHNGSNFFKETVKWSEFHGSVTQKKSQDGGWFTELIFLHFHFHALLETTSTVIFPVCISHCYFKYGSF